MCADLVGIDLKAVPQWQWLLKLIQKKSLKMPKFHKQEVQRFKT